MSLESYLASRYLLDRRHGAWGWLISLIATGSVALGVAALIVTLAIMTGFREDIRSKLLGIHPHIFISGFSGTFNPSHNNLPAILDRDKNVVAWSPFVSGQILVGRGKNSSGASLQGVDPKKEIRVADLDKKLVSGEWDDLQKTGEKPAIILGQELARIIGARVGDTVWVVTPNSIGISALSVPKANLFVVTGILKSGLYDYDSVLAYTALGPAKDLFNVGENVTGIGVRIKDPDKSEAVADRLREETGSSYWIRSWISQNRNLFSALKLERTVMFLVLAMLTVVASFMIVSNLLLTITQKVKEIGILRAMGATEGTVRKVFFLQGCIMGVVGNVAGVIAGLLISLTLEKTNIIKLPADVYYIDTLPIRILPGDVLTVVIVSIVVIMLATLLPAQKAAKMDPLEAIRYG